MTAPAVCFSDQLMLKPALAYPATVLIRVNPLAVAENTNISRV